MANQIWLVAAVGLVLGVASVLAAIPGPNDPRYPDYIVNPPVVCNKEGSFPHPRNCSWYYRCVDRMKVGYYWTYHFECEPGTVFLDALDQCVHPFDAPYACKNGPDPVPITDPTPPLRCEGVPGTCKTYDVCKPKKIKREMCKEIRCPLRTPNLSCGDGYAFDTKIQECDKIPLDHELCPTRPTSVFNCEGVPEKCTTYEVCSPQKANMTMCTEIWCPIRHPNLNCGAGYSFHIETQKCAPIPKETDLCPKLPVFNCTGVKGTCQLFDICSPLKEERLMCREIFCPLRDPNLSCGTGYLFDMKDQKCAKRPSDSQLCGATVTLPEVQLLPCAYNGQIPKTDFVVRKYCNDVALCDNGYFTETKELCDGYYECVQKSDGTWSVREGSCPAGLLYSFDRNACESAPDEDRCRFI